MCIHIYTAKFIFKNYTSLLIFLTYLFLLKSKQKFREEVGHQALTILVGVLQTDRTDTEITGYALDTLYNVMSGSEEGMPFLYTSLLTDID